VNCQFPALVNAAATCTVCGRSVRTNQVDGRRIHVRCGGPSLVRRIFGAALALAGFVADGCRTVSAERWAARLAICQTCDQYDSDRDKCRACGCRARLKSGLPRESCPLDRWPD